MNVSEFSNSPVIPPSAKRKQRKKRKKGKSPAVPDHSSSPESSDDELSCVAKEKNESALLNQAFNNEVDDAITSMVALIARKLQIDDSVVRSTVDFMWDQGLRYDNEEDVIRTVRGGHPQPSTASEADAIHTRDGSSEPEIDLYDVICAACSWLNTPEQQQAHLLQFVQSHGPEKLFYWILSNRLQWKSRPEIREALRHLLCSCFSQFQDVVDSFGSLVDQLVSLPSDEETTAKELGQVFRCSFERCRAIFLNTSSHPAASNGVTGAFGRREQALSRIQNAQYLANEKNHWAALIGDFKAAVENAFKHPIEDQTNHPASGVVQGRKEKIWEPKSTHEERREIESKLSQLRMVQAQLSAQLTACERDISQLMEKLREIDLQCGGLAERRPVQQHSVELVEVMRSIDSFVFTMDKSCCHHGPALWSTTFLGDYLEAEEECVKLVVDRIRLNQAKQNEIEKELAVYRSLALTRLTRDYENRREVLAKERSADMLALEQVMQTLSGMTGNSNLINDSLADHEVKHLETIVALMCDLGVDVPSTLWKYYRSDRAQNHCSLEITALQHKNEQKPDLRSSNSPTVDRDRGLDNGKPMKKPKKPRLKRVENGKHQREAKKSEDTSAVIAALEKLVAGKSNPRSLSLELAPSPVLERKSTFVEIQLEQMNAKSTQLEVRYDHVHTDVNDSIEMTINPLSRSRVSARS